MGASGYQFKILFFFTAMTQIKVRLCLRFQSKSKIAKVLSRAEISEVGNKLIVRGETIEDAHYLAKFSEHIAIRIYILQDGIEILEIRHNTPVCKQSVELTAISWMEHRMNKVLNR